MKLIKSIFWLPVQLFSKIILVFLGLFLVPFVIKDSIRQSKNLYGVYEGQSYAWWLLNVRSDHPLWLWGNDRDGLLGDTRGYYFKWCLDRKIKPHSWLSKYIWAAIRNPANNLRFAKWNACDVRECKFYTFGTHPEAKDKKGHEGFQLTIADNGKRYYFGFTLWYPYTENRGVLIKFGNKIDGDSKNKVYTEDDELKYFKGTAFYINPFKSL